MIDYLFTAQSFGDGLLSFVAAETGDSNIADQRHRNTPFNANPAMHPKIRGTVNRYLYLIPGSYKRDGQVRFVGVQGFFCWRCPGIRVAGLFAVLLCGSWGRGVVLR